MLNNKTVLITGADGFIGSHLTERLVKEGAKVKALSQYNSFNNWGWLEDVECKNDIEVLCGDVRDNNYIRHISKDVDVIFHLAALIAIPYSYIAPESYVDTNIKGTLNVCQAALDNNVEKVIITSTSEVYGTAQYVPIDEKHPIASGKKQIKLGDTTPTRDFNYVKDTCSGFVALANCDKAIGEEINIGSNFEISIGDTLNLIKEIMNSDVEFVTDEQRLRPKNSEVNRLWCDNSKIMTLTNFKPEYDIRRGLEETVKWFSNKDNLKKYKADIYNV